MIGSGHLMRCLTLADVLKAQGAKVHFICRHVPEALAQRVEEAGHSLHRLPKEEEDIQEGDLAHAYWLGVAQEVDAAQTRVCIEQTMEKAQWLFVDHYGIDVRWERALRGCCEQLGAIDDLADRQHEVDWLLDQNPMHGVSDYAFLVPSKARVLTGTAYALLRPGFAALREAARARRAQTETVRRVLVFFSNSASEALLAMSMEALLAYEKSLEITCIAGRHVESEALRALTKRTGRHQLTLVDYEPNMPEALLWADVALGAAGTASWERCALGLPAILGVLADNQLPLALAQEQHGNALYAGRAEDLNVVRLGELLPRVLDDVPAWHAMSEAAFTLCDGRGLERVLQSLQPEAFQSASDTLTSFP